VQTFFNKRRVALILIALAIAFITFQVLLLGTRCLVPSPFLNAGEVGTAETSIYGGVLYKLFGILCALCASA
jgi:hypothetical protein